MLNNIVMSKYIEIDVPYKSSLANYVKGYASSFSTIRNLERERTGTT